MVSYSHSLGIGSRRPCYSTHESFKLVSARWNRDNHVERSVKIHMRVVGLSTEVEGKRDISTSLFQVICLATHGQTTAERSIFMDIELE